MFYLLPHSSHVLQPLDLTCFSLLKSRYRDQITNLARFDDSSVVKKAQFLEYYNKAAQDGLNAKQITAGWKAAGIHPWNPRKTIRSRLIIQSHQNIQTTPRTPPSRKRAISNSDIYPTPIYKRSYRDSCYTIYHQEMVSRPVRSFLQKVGKTIDRYEWESAQKDLLLASQRSEIEDLHQKRQKKQIIDCNEAFANIETIKQAKQALAALPTTRRATRVRTSPTNTVGAGASDPQSAYMHVFSIN